MKETKSTSKHEASSPCSSSSSRCDGWTPPSSGPPSTVSTAKLNLPVEDVLSRGHSGLEGPDASSTIDGQMSRLSFHTSSNGVRVEHPGTEVLWQHLTDAVRAACTPPPRYRRISTARQRRKQVICLRDVMLAERMPDHLLAILPEDFEAVLITEGFNLAQQVFDDLALQEEEEEEERKCFGP